MIKKINIFCSLLVTLSMLNFFYFNASGESKICFSERVEYDSVEQNEFFYSVAVSEKSKICALSFRILYDETQLELVEYQSGEAISSTLHQVNSTINGKVLVTCITTNQLEKSGDIIKIRFKVLDDSSEFLSMSLRITECVDEQCNNLLFQQNDLKFKNPLYNSPEEGNSCGCICHSTNRIVSVIYPVIRFLWKIYSCNPVCNCSVEHY